MKLSEIFTQLAYGELSQIALGGNNDGEINESNYKPIIAHINLGLSALYTRFHLKEGRLAVPVMPAQTSYTLVGNILKVTEIYDYVGCAFALNDKADPASILTPSSKLLTVPLDVVNVFSGTSLDVVYRAGHPVISYELYEPELVEVELPYSHLEALLLFIASRVNNPIGMGQEFNAGNNYAAKYERACVMLETLGLEVDQGEQNTRMQRNGWV